MLIKTAIVILGCLFMNVSCLFSISKKPDIKKVDGRYTIILPASMERSLKNYDAEFVVWNQSEYLPSIINDYHFSDRETPFSIVGDFNSDGVLDVALHGHNKANDLIVCIISEKKDFVVIEIAKNYLPDPKKESNLTYKGKEYGLHTYLTYFHPQTIQPFMDGDLPLNLKSDAFQIEYYEQASTLYYYKDKAFVEYTTSD